MKGNILNKTLKIILLYLFSIVKWLWQLPQNLVAIIYEGFLCYSASYIGKYNGITIIRNGYYSSSVSLGNFIFLADNYSSTNYSTLKHELGHCKQSLILGWLYLIVIGLPSLLHLIIHKICGKIGIKWDYYSFYTERWANYLMRNLTTNVIKRELLKK